MRAYLQFAAGAVLTVTTFSQAHAQYGSYTNPYTGRTFNNPTSSFIDTVLLNNMRTQQLLTSQMISRNTMLSTFKSGTPKKQSKREKVVADRFAMYRGTMYTPSKLPVMPPRMAAMFIKEPGDQREAMTALFVKLFDIYKERARQQGAPPNDLARTMAYCIGANYAYYNQKEIPDSQVTALRAKIRAALAGDAKFRALSNAQKQDMNETLVILTHFMAAGYESGKEDRNQEIMKGFRKLAGMTLQSLLGVAPQRVAFSKTGLVIN